LKGRAASLLLAGLALAGVGLCILLFVELDSPLLGRALLDRASAAAGARLTARGFRLRLASGLALEGVEGGAVFEGGQAELALERLVFRHRLGPLLRGALSVDEVALVRPRIVLIEGPGPPRAPVRSRGVVAAAPAAPAALGRLGLHVEVITMEDARIELRAAGTAPLVVEDLDLRLRDVQRPARSGPALVALQATGEVAAASAMSGGVRAHDLRGELRLSDGQLLADPVRFVTDEGTFRGRLSVDLHRLPMTYALALDGDPLDLAKATGLGAGFGPGRLRLEARGAGTESAGLTGQGMLALAAGRLPDTPLLRALERAAGGTRLAGASYEATEARFRLDRGRLWIDRFALQAGDVGLEAGGWAGMDGALGLAITLRAPRDAFAVAGLAASTLDALTGADGRVAVPFRVSGTRQAPQVVPDAAALAAQARDAGARGLAGKAVDAVGRIFRRRR
jgi:hypothetical protein